MRWGVDEAERSRMAGTAAEETAPAPAPVQESGGRKRTFLKINKRRRSE